MVRYPVRLGPILTLAVLAACSKGTEAPHATTITVTPNAVSLASIGATQQMTAVVKDQNGNTMTGQTVAWATTNAGAATIGSTSGLVTAVANGTTSVSATSGTLQSAGVTVTVLQVPSLFTKQPGSDGQSGLINTALATPIAVKVADATNHAIVGAIVTFTPAAGDNVSQTADTTDVTGQAQVTWTLGSTGGAHSLGASVPTGGAPLTLTFGATAIAPGIPTSVAAFTTTTQTALAGSATNSRPAVLVKDGSNAALANIVVNFAVTAGGGSLVKAVDTTDANGIAQVGSWVTGSAGTNTMTATVASLTPVAFTANAQAAQYNVTLSYQTAIPSAGAQAAFDTAAAKWQGAIYGDLPDVPASITINPGQCGIPSNGSPLSINTTIDDIMILVRFDSIDGPLNILGSAGPCFIRTGGGAGDRLTVIGQMRFDTADVALLLNSGRFNGVVMHEMGHVLGIGTLWTQAQFNCLQNPTIFNAAGSDSVVNDANFSCTNGRAAFDSIGGTSYTGGNKVPVENTGGAGTANGHWRETVFDEELMTGFAEAAGIPTPLSLLTIASLQDLGYTVTYSAMEAYTQTFTAPPSWRARTADGGVPLKGDIVREPIGLIDRSGRVVGTIRPR